MCFDRNINGNRDDKFFEWDYWSLHWRKNLTLDGVLLSFDFFLNEKKEVFEEDLIEAEDVLALSVEFICTFLIDFLGVTGSVRNFISSIASAKSFPFGSDKFPVTDPLALSTLTVMILNRYLEKKDSLEFSSTTLQIMPLYIFLKEYYVGRNYKIADLL